VADGEVSLIEKRAFRALPEISLESTGFHFVDEVERPRAKLDLRTPAWVLVVVSKAIGCRAHRGSREESQDGGDDQDSPPLLHTMLLSVCGGEATPVQI
jgi:hypothetical protein